MERIGTSSNTIVPCFQVIKSKGYTITRKIYFTVDITEDAVYEFIAKKGENEFIGDTLEEVLGIITMREYRGKDKEDWRANHNEHLDYQKTMDNNTLIFDKDGNQVDEENL